MQANNSLSDVGIGNWNWKFKSVFDLTKSGWFGIRILVDTDCSLNFEFTSKMITLSISNYWILNFLKEDEHVIWYYT